MSTSTVAVLISTYILIRLYKCMFYILTKASTNNYMNTIRKLPQIVPLNGNKNRRKHIMGYYNSNIRKIYWHKFITPKILDQWFLHYMGTCCERINRISLVKIHTLNAGRNSNDHHVFQICTKIRRGSWRGVYWLFFVHMPSIINIFLNMLWWCGPRALDLTCVLHSKVGL